MESKVCRKIPPGVRCLAYNYLDFKFLLTRIYKLSKTDRKNCKNSELMDSPRHLNLVFKYNKKMKGWQAAADLATRITIKF